jgi:hypothetical protein
MAWGDNLLTNPSAETQDMTGWTYSGVSVEEKTTVASVEDVNIAELNVNLGMEVHIGLDGMTGEYGFIFASDADASMYQVIYASDLTGSPENVQFVCRYKLKISQNVWDNSVLGYAKLKIAYDDSTFDYFVIPLILGVKVSTRYYTDFWILVRNTCAVDTDKTIDYLEVRAEADKCTNLLLIDYFELREET